MILLTRKIIIISKILKRYKLKCRDFDAIPSTLFGLSKDCQADVP